MASLVSISLLLLAFSTSFEISASRKVELKTKVEKTNPILHQEDETSTIRFDPSKVIPLSWHPRAFLYKGFLSYGECDHLISQAHSKLENSMLNGNETGNSTLNMGISLSRGQDEIVSKIEERLSAWTFLPKENGEGIKIFRYKTNESHPPSLDDYHNGSKLVHGGHRAATVIMYLSRVDHGGETVFPKSELRNTQAKDETVSGCAGNGFALKPIKGDALLFFNLHPNTTTDTSSLHGSCTVFEGEKWSATKWIQMGAIGKEKPLPDPALVSDSECTDEDDNCSSWAATGECQRNPVFMLGSPDYFGSCRKSCGVC